MTTVFRKAFLTRVLFGCISSHFDGTANVTVSITSRGNHCAYHGKDHRNRDEILVVIGMFADEIEIPWGGGGGARTA